MNTTTEAPVNAMSFPVEEFDVATMAPSVMSLRINGIDDKDGAKAVKAARLKCVKMRCEIESKRKEFKEVWLRGGQAVDAMAKQLQAELAPLEQHCIAEEQAVADELKRIETERQEAIYQDRVAKMKQVGPHGTVVPEKHLREMSPAQFAEYLADLVETAARKAESDRIAKEQAEANQIEAERLRKEREEFEAKQAAEVASRKVTSDRLSLLAKVGVFPDVDAIAAMESYKFLELLATETGRFNREREQQEESRRHIADQQRAIDAENKRIADENAARIRQENIDRAAKEAAEQATRDTEARIKREAEVAEQNRLAEIARAEKQAALRPAKEKLNAFAIAVSQLGQPQISVEVDRKVLTLVNALVKGIGRIADEME